MYCPKCDNFLACTGKPEYRDKGDLLVEIWRNQKCGECGTIFTCKKFYGYIEEDEYTDVIYPEEKRAVRSKSAKTRIPCPKCGTRMDPTEMKYNGHDEDGNLFESYKCSTCNARFSITYDGPNDDCSWDYDLDTIECLSKKRGILRRKR